MLKKYLLPKNSLVRKSSQVTNLNDFDKVNVENNNTQMNFE
jgi:hypothetical protein